jgi:inner membrane transporter RhtA
VKRWAPVAAVLASMSTVQVGGAVSVGLFPRLGVAGTTWLRLLVAAVLLLALVRPRGLDAAALRAAGLLGAVMAANSVLFAAATARIPLGVTVAIEFCGPLVVAVASSRAGVIARLGWPAAALTGVVLLTRPWSLGDNPDPQWLPGIGFAVLAGIGWAGYIVLMARVGRRSGGLSGLAVALAASALVLLPLGLPDVLPVLREAASGGAGAGSAAAVLGRCALAAVLVPLLPYALELVALRRMPQAVFGVWMALEPAIGATVGLVMLAQRPDALQVPGLALVVLAGLGAEATAYRAAQSSGGSASTASSASASAALSRPEAIARSAVERAR